ncbi:hypothetical protein Ancab_020373 [Ancistrocladus abbreviatus]
MQPKRTKMVSLHKHHHQLQQKSPLPPPQDQTHHYFPVGSEVEVTSDEEGFKGAWYVGKVLKSPPKSLKNKLFIEYKSLLSDENGSEPLKEYVDVSFVRPVADSQRRKRERKGFSLRRTTWLMLIIGMGGGLGLLLKYAVRVINIKYTFRTLQMRWNSALRFAGFCLVFPKLGLTVAGKASFFTGFGRFSVLFVIGYFDATKADEKIGANSEDKCGGMTPFFEVNVELLGNV